MIITIKVPNETDTISWSSMFVWSTSFMRKKQTAMQANPLHEKEAAIDARVDGIYRVLKGRISLDNLIPSCIEVAQEIEGIHGLGGKEKLDTLQKVFRQALKDSDKSAEEKEQILHLIETVVPMIVQAAILASKHPIAVQVHAAVVSCCIPRVKKVVSSLPPNVVE